MLQRNRNRTYMLYVRILSVYSVPTEKYLQIWGPLAQHLEGLWTKVHPHQQAVTPLGSTLQCDTWLWDDMPSNSPIRPPYCNSTYGFDFEQITAVDMSFCTSLRNFIQIGPPSAEKNDVMTCRYSRWRIYAILDFRDPLKKPNYITSYRSSIDTVALNCLDFEKIAFFCILATDRLTDKQTDRSTGPSY